MELFYQTIIEGLREAKCSLIVIDTIPDGCSLGFYHLNTSLPAIVVDNEAIIQIAQNLVKKVVAIDTLHTHICVELVMNTGTSSFFLVTPW